MKVTKEMNPFEFCDLQEDCDCGCPLGDMFPLGKCPVIDARYKPGKPTLMLELILKDRGD